MLGELLLEEEPAARLVRLGIESLCDAELLRVVVMVGRRRTSAASLVQRIRERYPTVEALAAASPQELSSRARIPTEVAAAISAAIALGRRADRSDLERGTPVTRSEEVFRHFHARLAGLQKERFYVVMLDGKGRMMRDVCISEGSLTASLVHPREVFRSAIREAAASILLVHNHPSGDPEPSPEDVALTVRLRAAGELLGIRVLDHVIIGRGRYASFADDGRL